MDSNKDAAEACLRLGKSALDSGDVDKAQRLLSKSKRLFPTPEVETLLALLNRATLAAGDSTSTSGESTPAARGGGLYDGDSFPRSAGAGGGLARDAGGGGGGLARDNSSGSGSEASAAAAAGAGGSAGQEGGAKEEEGLRHRHGQRQQQQEQQQQRENADSDAASSSSASGKGPPLSASGGGGLGARSVSGLGSGSQTVSEEHVLLVRRILRNKTDFYEMLEISKTCTEDDVKKAYRRLSLKVHPDKNKAPGAEEAFKLVSRAFKCLSDPDLRANYDRFGHEDPAQSRLQRQQQQRQQRGFGYEYGHGHGHPFRGQAFFDDDFDPNDIFNAFFYGQTVNGRMYRMHRTNRANGGAGGGGRAAQGGGDQSAARNNNGGSNPANIIALLQLVPVIAFLAFSLLPQSDPPARSVPSPPYTVELRTARVGVPFYVKVKEEFEKSFPEGSVNRQRMELGFEAEYREQVEARCYQERVQVANYYRWGKAAKAKAHPTPYCDELRRLQTVR